MLAYSQQSHDAGVLGLVDGLGAIFFANVYKFIACKWSRSAHEVRGCHSSSGCRRGIGGGGKEERGEEGRRGGGGRGIWIFFWETDLTPHDQRH